MNARSRELPSTSPDMARMEQFKQALRLLEATYYRACTTPIGDNDSADQWLAARAALTALYQQAAEDNGKAERWTTDDMRRFTLSVNDRRLNTEKVSVNQVREILRALAFDVEERDVTASDPTPNRPEAGGE